MNWNRIDSGNQWRYPTLVKTITLQFLVYHWKAILLLSSSSLLSSVWTLARKIFGRGGLFSHFLSLTRTPPVAPYLYQSTLQSVFSPNAFVCHSPSGLAGWILPKTIYPKSTLNFGEHHWYIQSGLCAAPYGCRAAVIKKITSYFSLCRQRDQAQTWTCVCIPVLVVHSVHTVTVTMWLHNQKSFLCRSIHTEKLVPLLMIHFDPPLSDSGLDVSSHKRQPINHPPANQTSP